MSIRIIGYLLIHHRLRELLHFFSEQTGTVKFDNLQTAANLMNMGDTEAQARCIFWTLKTPGRLVANTVTLAGEEKLQRQWHDWGGEMSRIDVSRLLPVGGQHGWKPFRPVTHYQVWKKDG